MSDPTEQQSTITELSRSQRRVLGVLMEKGLTTPEYYPLTLKAIATGANQKSNRSPVTSYSEDELFNVLDELRELGLAAVVHTESGRTERYRHYVRKVFPYSEAQLAIMAELLLRGQQQLGELRARASRMVGIENQNQLKDELTGLIEMGHVQTNGDLDRRGIEVDHGLYTSREQENHPFGKQPQSSPGESKIDKPTPAPVKAESAKPPVAAPAQAGVTQTEFDDLNQRHQQLTSEVEELRNQLHELRDQYNALQQKLDSVL